MNTELLRQVQTKILSEPESFDMDFWYKDDEIRKKRPYLGRNETSCGTTACIAGWAVVLSSDEEFPSLRKLLLGKDISAWAESWTEAGARALGLQPHTDVWLFYREDWPEEWYDCYEYAETPLERAKAVIRLIDCFIEANGDKYRMRSPYEPGT